MGETPLGAGVSDSIGSRLGERIDMFDEMLSAGFANLIMEAYNLGYSDGLADAEHNRFAGAPPLSAVQDEVRAASPANAYNTKDSGKTKRRKKPMKTTSQDDTRLDHIDAMPRRISNLLFMNDILTVADARAYELEHADEGGLCNLHYFGDKLKTLMEAALNTIGVSLFDY